ncbi:hypothetical protein [Plantibacter sp. YIM 135249]|uniref:hypothetical protein n=1 Tax=Plantibacter sp. YIM 135249 TaxID=3423918 RepID=UPI003D343D1A
MGDLSSQSVSELIRRGEDCIDNIDELGADAPFWILRAKQILYELERRAKSLEVQVAAVESTPATAPEPTETNGEQR